MSYFPEYGFFFFSQVLALRVYRLPVLHHLESQNAVPLSSLLSSGKLLPVALNLDHDGQEGCQVC